MFAFFYYNLFNGSPDVAKSVITIGFFVLDIVISGLQCKYKIRPKHYCVLTEPPATQMPGGMRYTEHYYRSSILWRQDALQISWANKTIIHET